MRRLAGVATTVFAGVLLLVLALAALMGSTAAAMSSASVLGLVCLAGLMGLLGLGCGLGLGALGGYLLARQPARPYDPAAYPPPPELYPARPTAPLPAPTQTIQLGAPARPRRATRTQPYTRHESALVDVARQIMRRR